MIDVGQILRPIRPKSRQFIQVVINRPRVKLQEDIGRNNVPNIGQIRLSPGTATLKEILESPFKEPSVKTLWNVGPTLPSNIGHIAPTGLKTVESRVTQLDIGDTCALNVGQPMANNHPVLSQLLVTPTVDTSDDGGQISAPNVHILTPESSLSDQMSPALTSEPTFETQDNISHKNVPNTDDILPPRRFTLHRVYQVSINKIKSDGNVGETVWPNVGYITLPEPAVQPIIQDSANEPILETQETVDPTLFLNPGQILNPYELTTNNILQASNPSVETDVGQMFMPIFGQTTPPQLPVGPIPQVSPNEPGIEMLEDIGQMCAPNICQILNPSTLTPHQFLQANTNEPSAEFDISPTIWPNAGHIFNPYELAAPQILQFPTNEPAFGIQDDVGQMLAPNIGQILPNIFEPNDIGTSNVELKDIIDFLPFIIINEPNVQEQANMEESDKINIISNTIVNSIDNSLENTIEKVTRDEIEAEPSNLTTILGNLNINSYLVDVSSNKNSKISIIEDILIEKGENLSEKYSQIIENNSIEKGTCSEANTISKKYENEILRTEVTSDEIQENSNTTSSLSRQMDENTNCVDQFLNANVEKFTTTDNLLEKGENVSGKDDKFIENKNSEKNKNIEVNKVTTDKKSDKLRRKKKKKKTKEDTIYKTRENPSTITGLYQEIDNTSGLIDQFLIANVEKNIAKDILLEKEENLSEKDSQIRENCIEKEIDSETNNITEGKTEILKPEVTNDKIKENPNTTTSLCHESGENINLVDQLLIANKDKTIPTDNLLEKRDYLLSEKDEKIKGNNEINNSIEDKNEIIQPEITSDEITENPSTETNLSQEINKNIILLNIEKSMTTDDVRENLENLLEKDDNSIDNDNIEEEIDTETNVDKINELSKPGENTNSGVFKDVIQTKMDSKNIMLEAKILISKTDIDTCNDYFNLNDYLKATENREELTNTVKNKPNNNQSYLTEKESDDKNKYFLEKKILKVNLQKFSFYPEIISKVKNRKGDITSKLQNEVTDDKKIVIPEKKFEDFVKSLSENAEQPLYPIFDKEIKENKKDKEITTIDNEKDECKNSPKTMKNIIMKLINQQIKSKKSTVTTEIVTKFKDNQKITEKDNTSNVPELKDSQKISVKKEADEVPKIDEKIKDDAEAMFEQRTFLWTHVIEGNIIQESDVAFPIRQHWAYEKRKEQEASKEDTQEEKNTEQKKTAEEN